MKTPHKHAALIHEWADGAEIQWMRANGDWADVINPDWDAFHEFCEFRVKPEPLRYRNYLKRSLAGGPNYVGVALEEHNTNDPREKWGSFTRWLGDWQEVEVPEELK